MLQFHSTIRVKPGFHFLSFLFHFVNFQKARLMIFSFDFVSFFFFIIQNLPDFRCAFRKSHQLYPIIFIHHIWKIHKKYSYMKIYMQRKTKMIEPKKIKVCGFFFWSECKVNIEYDLRQFRGGMLK